MLGGISPIDPNFIELLDSATACSMRSTWSRSTAFRWTGITGRSHEWPREDRRDPRRGAGKPVWVSEAGASSFGAEEVQLFGLQRTAELLLPLVERVHWYSLFDLPSTWTATTRHKEAEGSAYYRHYYMGLLREDGIAEAGGRAVSRRAWASASGSTSKIIGWSSAVRVAAQAGGAHLRTGVSWADWFRPELGAVVRPPDGRAGRVRHHHDALLHAGASGHCAALHQPAEGPGGLRRLRRAGRCRAMRRACAPMRSIGRSSAPRRSRESAP